MRMVWKPGHTPQDMSEFLKSYYVVQKKAELDAAIEAMLPKITLWMKDNAPWEDRTGNARRSLRAEISAQAKVFIVLWFTYGADIDYAIFLEEMQAGRFSILPKTMDYWQPKIFKLMKQVYGAK